MAPTDPNAIPPSHILPRRTRFVWFLRLHAQMVLWVFEYLWARRAWPMAPLILILLLMGAVIFVSSNPTVSPFLYALF